MKKVMLFGTFDIIHPGHLNLFRQAKQFGTTLYVVLARDETVSRLKNFKPNDEMTRLHNLKKIPLVDEVILGDYVDKLKAVKEIKPDVICLGYDQSYFVDQLEAYIQEHGLDVIIERLKPYKPEVYKSAKMRDLIKKRESD